METDDQRQEATKIVEAKLGFYIHLIVYVLVNAGLIAINLITDPDHLWFQWPLLGWGAGVLLHGLLLMGQMKGGSIKEWMIDRELKKRGGQHPQ